MASSLATKPQNQKTEPRIAKHELICQFDRALERSESESDDGEFWEYRVKFSTSHPVLRFDWWDWKYFEEVLSFEKKAVDTTRIKQKVCPFLDNHNSYGEHLGMVRDIELDAEKGEGFVTIRLRKNYEPAAQLKEDIENETNTGVSVGYIVKEYEVTEEEDPPDKFEKRLATKWEPIEVSRATIPADPYAGFERSLSLYDAVRNKPELHPCSISKREVETKTELESTGTFKGIPIKQIADKTQQPILKVEGFSNGTLKVSETDRQAIVDAVRSLKLELKSQDPQEPIMSNGLDKSNLDVDQETTSPSDSVDSGATNVVTTLEIKSDSEVTEEIELMKELKILRSAIADLSANQALLEKQNEALQIDNAIKEEKISDLTTTTEEIKRERDRAVVGEFVDGLINERRIIPNQRDAKVNFILKFEGEQRELIKSELRNNPPVWDNTNLKVISSRQQNSDGGLNNPNASETSQIAHEAIMKLKSEHNLPTYAAAVRMYKKNGGKISDEVG